MMNKSKDTSSAPAPVKQSQQAEDLSTDEARFAALRNHRIRFADAINPNAERVHKLHKIDIVFGRGKGFQNHPGNQRMRQVIDKYKTSYHSLKRAKKRELVEAIYNELVEGGARFLKKLDDENAWVKVDPPVALQKVSHTLRCRKKLDKFDDEQDQRQARDGVIAFSRGRLLDAGPQAALHGMVPNQALSLASMNQLAGLDPLAGGLGDPLMAGMDSLSAAAMPSGFDPSIAALEAQRNAAFRRFRALSTTMPTMGGAMGGSMGMGPMALSSMAFSQAADPYSMLRREQLMMQQQLMMPGMAALDPSLAASAGKFFSEGSVSKEES